MPALPVIGQSAPPPTTSAPVATAAQTTPQPQGLPVAPSALISAQDTILVRPIGSGASYAAMSSTPGPGGLQIEKPSDTPLPLSLDDAIAFGLKRNYRLKYERANQRTVRGYKGLISNALLPNLQARAASSAQEINLAAMGFNPASVGPLLADFGFTAASFPTIVKVNTTTAQVNLNQTLFDMPSFELFRAIKPEFRTVDLNIENAQGDLVQAVTTAYLKVLADQANLANTVAQETSARVLLDQAQARETAGVGVRLDTLRAQVEFQNRQQQHLSAESQLDKDGIQLNRTMGIPAGQQLDLTDQSPFSELADLDLEQAKSVAYTNRRDLQSLQASIEVATREARAIKYQRLPTVAVNGFYGVLGQDGGLFHGVFTAQGTLKFPIFREAAQRGEEETASAQLFSLRQQEANLRATIEAQIRTSTLDVASSQQLVAVARSNAELAIQELSDARDRFAAGVTDNLEVVNAQATVTGAQAQLVNALYQFNVAKVGLARSMGLLQTRYRAFLGM